eukprot:8320123-Heterocapsa_arctica.AAC.1
MTKRPRGPFDGCSRFHAGQHFPSWTYNVDADPDSDGLILKKPTDFAPGAAPSKIYKAFYA